MRLKVESLVFPLIALAFGLAVALTIAAVLGESPFHVFWVMVSGALGSPTGIGYSLYYATPLMMTGLAVAWAFRAGLFNIGADGQMAIGGVAVAAVGILAANLPWYLAWPSAFLAAFVSGGAWGAIAGWIKAKRGCHEVLTTILLNFVAYGLTSFFILSVFKNRESQVPETAEVGAGFHIPGFPAWFGGTSPVNGSLLLAILLAVVYGLVMSKTRLGFYQRLAGSAPETGARAGIRMDLQVILAMFISGGLAGLASLSPVLGFAWKAREGFTSGAGFVGVAVALLARGTPMGIILAALLFGILNKGALDLDIDTRYVSRDLATVIQGLIVVAVASQAGVMDLWRRWRSSRAKA